MFFRNLTLFRLSMDAAQTLDDAQDLETAFNAHRLRSCGPLELATHGFVPPVPGNDRLLLPVTVTKNRVHVFCIGSETKILPASVINQEVANKIQQVAEQQQRPVGGRERKRIKAQVLDALLPRAFARPSRVYGYIDLASGYVVFDTSSHKAAATALSLLRDALGSFPAMPLAPGKSVRQILTTWLGHPESLPYRLSLGDECELSNPADRGSKWRGTHDDLESEPVLEHLRNGMSVNRLGLAFHDRMGFVLDESLTVRKLRFFDVVTDTIETMEEPDSVDDEYAARFTLMHLELSRLFSQLETWFEFPRPA